jgi:hypothetical protein
MVAVLERATARQPARLIHNTEMKAAIILE